MEKIKIEVLPHSMFEEKCKKEKLNDSNVDDKNWAFIDIIGTEECLKYYLNEPETKHYFNNEHGNVLNLEFDDVNDDVIYNGHLFKTIHIDQAEKVVNFIEEQIEKGVECIRITCRAGMSRSRAVGEFIYRFFDNVDYEDRGDYIMFYNQQVLRMLNHAYWKKHKMYEYEDGSDYPEDIANIEIIEL